MLLADWVSERKHGTSSLSSFTAEDAACRKAISIHISARTHTLLLAFCYLGTCMRRIFFSPGFFRCRLQCVDCWTVWPSCQMCGRSYLL